MPRPKKIQPAEVLPTDPATALALRVWDGQSPSLPRHERVARVRRALAEQGFDADTIANVQLPE